MPDLVRLPFARFTSLLTPILERVEREPGAHAITFLEDDGARHPIELSAVHTDATVRASGLAALGIRRGDVVILVMGHSRALISTFLGALYVGAVPAIFPYLTEKLDPTIYAERVRAMVRGAGATALITTSALRGPVARLVADLRCRVADDQEVAAAAVSPPAGPPAPATREDVAYLQYTSGTSGLQKGVPQTHGALLRYIEANVEVEDLTRADVIVSWLPLSHDLGLVTGLLLPLVLGIPSVLMSPFRWVRDPTLLFQSIHEFRGTLCWMPNFALNHCVRAVRTRDLEGLDLEHWRRILLGGEPVRLDSLQQFEERFRPYGLGAGVLHTGYGMAENVCAATTTDRTRPVPVDRIRTDALERDARAVPAAAGFAGAVTVVSCGKAYPETQLRVVDRDGVALPERSIGEVVIRSPYLFSGYYHRPDLTAQAMRDGWFLTGDLGYLAAGDLYVCGRKSDIMIVGGRNIQPDEIEALAGTVPGLRAGRAVAFGIDDERTGTQRVVLVCEVQPDLAAADLDAIHTRLRRRAAQEHDVTLADVRLVEKGWVIKTSNGKLARPANREKYLRAVGAEAMEGQNPP